MEDNIYTALKRRIESFVTMPADEWNDFSTKWHPKEIAKDTFLIKPGQIERYFYYMGSGVIRLFIDKNEVEINVGFTYNDEFSGVYDSFLTQTPAESYLHAITPCSVLRISYEDLMAQFDKYKSVERWGRLFNAKMLIGMAKRQVEARSFSAEEKFIRLFNQSPHIFQLIPQKYLASYLGMTPETFSRLRRKIATIR